MKSHTFKCPACQTLLSKEIAPNKSKSNPQPYVILWCAVGGRCPSYAANDGGSGPTEEAAYRALRVAVKAEEDKATEEECEPLTAEDRHDANAWAKAEHANDMAKAGGA